LLWNIFVHANGGVPYGNAGNLASFNTVLTGNFPQFHCTKKMETLHCSNGKLRMNLANDYFLLNIHPAGQIFCHGKVKGQGNVSATTLPNSLMLLLLKDQIYID